MYHEEKEKLFKVPIYLNGNLEVIPAPNNKVGKYLLIIDDRYYIINQFVYDLISIIKEYHSLDEILELFSSKQGKHISKEILIDIINKDLAPIKAINLKNEIYLPKKKHFLYFKHTLLKESAVNRFTSYLKYLYIPRIFIFLLFVFLATHILLFLNFSNLEQLYSIVYEPQNLALSLIFITISTVFHEFGHASACKYYNVRHGEIGMGLYLNMPVLYSNTNDSWRLSKDKRVMINFGGIYFQFILNIIFIFVSIMFKIELLMNISLIIFFQTLIMLNPFLRFDGYWITSDLLDIPNLRNQSTRYFSYIISRIFKRSASNNIMLPDVKSINIIIFSIYAVTSNLFFVFFVLIIVKNMPELIMGLPRFIDTFSISFEDNFKNCELKELLLLIYHLFVKLFIIIFTLYYLYKIFLKIIRLALSIIKT